MKSIYNLLFLLLTIHYGYGQGICSEVDLEEGLIAHFPLNTNAIEKTGSGFNGTINGALQTSDKDGNANSAYLFDGVNDYIKVGDHFDLGTSNFTISCWVKVLKFKDLIPGTSSRGGWIVNKGITIFGTPIRAGYALDAQRINGENAFFFFVGGESNNLYNVNSAGFKENVWYSLIGIKAKDSISLYVDNELVGTTFIPSNINVNTNIPLVFGSIDKLGNDVVGTTYFDGVIDDVRIYNKVLTAEERTCLINPCAKPVVNLGEDRSLCNINSFQLNATVPEGKYKWQDGSTNPTIEITSSGLYWVTVTNDCGSSSDSIFIEFNNMPILNLGEDVSTCEDNEIVLEAGFPNATYRWSDGSSSSSLQVNESGIYWLEIENNCGITRDSIKVEFNKLPDFDLGEDRTVCDLDYLRLDATVPGGTYKWQDGSENPIFEVRKSGTYWVEVENSCGIVIDKVNITFPEYEDIIIPNVFTPNGDDKNEYFIIDSRLLGSSLRVFQRTGKKVYESGNYYNKWNGSNLPSDIYYWIINGPCGSVYKGWVNILY
ncbi:hypothetical protein C9994_04680 [Marivirga lumbricoides]|uniref:LamG-like jellyroll fold domain-containing protein n=1 Tax=Marivirga lumbricoides TaxID=1046115 RepID=A0A2T4DT94_9BACT|nr:hypothetical protein C9994_04680 [Marivirga lumbricoides]